VKPVKIGDEVPLSTKDGKPRKGHKSTPKDIEWMKQQVNLPVVVKGIMGADDARVAVNSGADWATVAHQYSNGDSEPAGGDLGLATANRVSDLEFQKELFELPLNGTTGIVRGPDDAYRIGRVTEIVPAGEQAGLRDQLLERLSEASVRTLLTYEAGAGELHDKITNDALAETPEQARIAVIYIDGEVSDDPIAAQGETDYSEIVFAPGDDFEIAADLPADDPAWTQALADAQAAYDQLKAITDAEQRKTSFAELAQQESDSDTGQDGGSVGFVTRDLPPTAVADALFTGTYTGRARRPTGYQPFIGCIPTSGALPARCARRTSTPTISCGPARAIARSWTDSSKRCVSGGRSSSPAAPRAERRRR